jgi:2-polyprenyl-6-methoxyphenol hydroxylase-like FAD-dependent oxidoreductase
MSPVGGVGINLAVQDAVAAANVLAVPLNERRANQDMLAAIQRRRDFPMRAIQRIQVVVQNMLLAPALASRARPKPPLPLKLMNWFPVLRRIPARVIGMGFRPEHIRSPEVA